MPKLQYRTHARQALGHYTHANSPPCCPLVRGLELYLEFELRMGVALWSSVR
jgi:hypothetical protein